MCNMLQPYVLMSLVCSCDPYMYGVLTLTLIGIYFFVLSRAKLGKVTTHTQQSPKRKRLAHVIRFYPKLLMHLKGKQEASLGSH